LIIVAGIFYVKPRLPILNGYSAKKACSCYFISGRSLSSIKANDLQIFPTNYAKIKIEDNTVTSTFFGFGARKAVFKKGLGCTLLPIESEKIENKNTLNIEYKNDGFFSNTTPSGNAKLAKAINNAFDNDNEKIKKTRAVVVLKDGQLIAEKYAEGFNYKTPILGWSMTKSITSAAVGILVKQGKLSIDKSNLFKEWEQDDRKEITINDLLHMGSGLTWDETYKEISDATIMLYTKKDFSTFAINKPLAYKPNSTWNYSSGTTNIVSKIISEQFSTQNEYYQFFYDELLLKIGMQNVVLETDATGLLVGSSYCYATPRDWARFGQLYLNDGVWNGERLLPEGWVEYSYTNYEPSKGEYGAHWWINKSKKLKDIDENVYWCSGFQEQRVFVVPNENMIVVRLGLSDKDSFDFNTFLSEIIEATKN